jgi:hypothetical protein
VVIVTDAGVVIVVGVAGSRADPVTLTRSVSGVGELVTEMICETGALPPGAALKLIDAGFAVTITSPVTASVTGIKSGEAP